MVRALVASAAVLAASVAGAAAGDAQGIWLRDSGASKVRIAPCGEALCGAIIWLKEFLAAPPRSASRCSST